MKSSLTAVALTVLMGLTSVGCVSQRQYDELELGYRKSQEMVAELQARIDELNQRIRLLESDPQEQARRIAELMSERDALMKKLGDLERQYNELASRQPAIALPKELDAALRDFAAKYPDLVEYDPNLGMVKFRSDLTFALGSADLTAGARSTLGKLAEILNGPIASRYEVRIVGHTDSVPISRPETRAKHPTNWHLSVHRSISVREALESSGVPAVRTSVAGYSMYRPVVQNARGGAEPNRRVELYLVPMLPVNESLLPAAAPATRSAAPKPAAPAAPSGDFPLK